MLSGIAYQMLSQSFQIGFENICLNLLHQFLHHNRIQFLCFSQFSFVDQLDAGADFTINIFIERILFLAAFYFFHNFRSNLIIQFHQLAVFQCFFYIGSSLALLNLKTRLPRKYPVGLVFNGSI